MQGCAGSGYEIRERPISQGKDVVTGMTAKETKRELEQRKLPELLAFADGVRVEKKEDMERRRQQIREILCREFGGYSPAFPVTTEGKVCIREENAYGGKAVREKIVLTFQTPFNAFSFAFELFLPRKAIVETDKDKTETDGNGVPVFVYLGFTGTPADGPCEEIIDNGFALAHINYQEIAPDRNDGFLNGLGTFCSRNPFDSWGKLGMWAYGASRAADYLSGRPEIDRRRMAVMGHSRLGKAALWCGAMDERFALTVSNDSGGGGAALFRGKRGERIADLAKEGSAHWFCGNFLTYAGREEELPFDQHFLLAMTAPRHLYVASASLDEWADPLSEFLSCAAASGAFACYGVPGLVLEETEEEIPHSPLHQGHIGYHLRQGTHHLGREDWKHVMEYRRKHGV